MDRELALIAHNIRSTHNVGSLLRTADGMGVDSVFLTGYTPYPQGHGDARLPHEASKVNKQIIKTSLGAEDSVGWRQADDIFGVIRSLKSKGYKICALEQRGNSIQLPDFKPLDKVALIVGREVEGIEPEIIDVCDQTLEIPMLGSKESLNVTQAAAIGLYHMRFWYN